MLIAAAHADDNAAWTALIGRFERMLRAVARSYRLNEADVEDVLQMVWLRLHQHLDRIRKPERARGLARDDDSARVAAAAPDADT